MGDLITKIGAVILIIVVVTFFVNHGDIDFTYVDTAATIAKDAINSDEGQEIVTELKDITIDVVSELTTETHALIRKALEKKEKVEVSLIKVVDGDTLIVNLNGDNTKIRLIGIDTPESVNPDESLNNEYGDLASAHTKELLKDVSTLYLDFDDEIEDQYGRTLAYVWLQKDCKDTTDNIQSYMLNGMILRDGYAMDEKYEPNTKYSASFSMIRKSASNSNKGLWSDEGFRSLWE